jgi:hypothetical protein
MQRATNREIADQLLMEWHAWTAGWRPDLGVPGCAPECRQATSSRQWDSTSDIVGESCRKTEMDAVQFCYDALEFAYQNAIAVEMKNREVKAKVWRSKMGKTFDEAMDAIMPVMRRKGLFD